MKKLVLSALMIVAFSSVSMAKTREVKVKKSKISKIFYFKQDCLSGAKNVYKALVNSGYSSDTAFGIAESGYWACMSN